MKSASCGIRARGLARLVAILVVFSMLSAPPMAQNKKNSWEVFIYFGGFFGNDVPAASQFGDIRTYRTDQTFAVDPFDINHIFTPNLGLIGGQGIPPDPNYPFITDPGTQFFQEPCQNNSAPPNPNDPNDAGRIPYYDECDQDVESRYLYNAQGVVTNGEIQSDDTEFTLGIRGGYNITRHWEIELDLGFGKQRLDLTQNLVELLTTPVGDINHPLADQLADFYQFTWANIDYTTIVPDATSAPKEHPNVVASRKGNDPVYNIPKYFPNPRNYSGPPIAGETFADVTGFVNRVFQDPTAFRNRGNQINIDNFSLALSANYNFNTKADSRIVPYLSAGIGQWMRNFDSPYDGDNTGFWLAGTGVRFFVNEIFSFRADLRWVNYLDDTFTITGALENFNLPDTQTNFGNCVRDNPEIDPPCLQPGSFDPNWAFPDLNGGGGNANIEVEAELDDFYEIRLGFDVILGGK